LPKTGHRIPEYLTESELKLLIATPYKTQVQHILAMRLMAQCGLRVSEAVSVKPTMFESFPRYAKLKVRGKGRGGGKDRIVPIPLDLWNAISDYVKNNGIGYEDYLFPGVSGEFMNPGNVRQFVKAYGVRAGIVKDIHPHMLRHTFSVQFLKACGTLRTLQTILGHTSLTTTQIYLEITEEDMFDDFVKHPVIVGA